MDDKKVKAVFAAAKELKELHGALTTRKADLETQKKAIEERNKTIYRMPLTSDEVKSFIFENIDRLASEFVRSANWTSLISDHLVPKGQRPLESGGTGRSDRPLDLRDVDFKNLSSVLNFDPASNFFTGALGTASAALDVRRAYFFFGDQIKGAIERRFASLLPSQSAGKLVAAEDGLTIEQKREEIAVNSERIKALDAEIEKADAQLLEVDGFSVYPKPNPHPYV